MSQLQSYSRLSWERFVLDLELLDVEAPHSLPPLVASLNQVLWPDTSYDQLLRELNFMAFEVQHRTLNLNDEGKIKELNRYFFCDKGFAICNQQELLNERSWQLIKVLSLKRGSGLMISLIYLHLANQLELPFFMVFGHDYSLVKWVGDSKNYFLDLRRSGLPLNDEQMVAHASIIQTTQPTNDQRRAFEILPNRQIFLEYASSMGQIFKDLRDLNRLHTCLNAQILIVDDDLDLVAARALLRKNLGLVKEALSDLKRYFSFIDRHQAPIELQEAFRDLSYIEKQSPRTTLEILH